MGNFDRNINVLSKYDALKVNCNTIYNYAQEDANNTIGYKILPVVLTRDIEISDLRAGSVERVNLRLQVSTCVRKYFFR